MKIYQTFFIVGLLGSLISLWAGNGFSPLSTYNYDPLIWVLIIFPVFAVTGLFGLIGWLVKRRTNG